MKIARCVPGTFATEWLAGDKQLDGWPWKSSPNDARDFNEDEALRIRDTLKAEGISSAIINPDGQPRRLRHPRHRRPLPHETYRFLEQRKLA